MALVISSTRARGAQRRGRLGRFMAMISRPIVAVLAAARLISIGVSAATTTGARRASRAKSTRDRTASSPMTVAVTSPPTARTTSGRCQNGGGGGGGGGGRGCPFSSDPPPLTRVSRTGARWVELEALTCTFARLRLAGTHWMDSLEAKRVPKHQD